MKRCPLYFALAFITLSLSFSVKAQGNVYDALDINYRWFELVNEPNNYQDAFDAFFTEQEETHQNYIQSFTPALTSQIRGEFSEPFKKDIPLKTEALKTGQNLTLNLQKDTALPELYLDEELVLSTKDLDMNERFTNFYTSPGDKYAVVPVYASGSTDHSVLIIIDLSENKILTKIDFATNYGHQWINENKLRFHLESDNYVSMVYDTQTNSFISNQENFLEISPSEKYYTEVGSTFDPDTFESKINLTITSFDKKNSATKEIPGWYKVQDETDYGFILLERTGSEREIESYHFLEVTQNDEGNINVGELKKLDIDSQGNILNSFNHKGYMIFETLYGVETFYHIFSPQGNFIKKVQAPRNASLVWIESDKEKENSLKLTYRSPVVREYIYTVETPEFNFDTAKIDQETMVDTNGIEYTTEFFNIPIDDVKVPVRIVKRKDHENSPNSKLFVRAYGGHNVVSDFKPMYDTFDYIFLRSNGIMVYPGVRGGGEFGPEWNRAGRLFNKLNTARDVVATVAAFHNSGVGSPETTAFMGTSSGGLLASTILTKAPQHFKLIIPVNGLADLLRKEILDESFNKGWQHEYGDHYTAQGLNLLQSYSPLIHAHNQQKLPTVYLVAGSRDSRVNPAHSLKLYAALKGNSATENPIVLDYAKESGHWATSASYEGLNAINLKTRMLASLFNELGMDYIPNASQENETTVKSLRRRIHSPVGKFIYERLQKNWEHYNKSYNSHFEKK